MSPSPGRQIHAAHVGGAVSGGGDAQNGAGVLRGFVGVQAVPVRLRRVGHGGFVIDGGRLAGQQSGGAQAHHRPITAHGSRRRVSPATAGIPPSGGRRSATGASSPPDGGAPQAVSSRLSSKSRGSRVRFMTRMDVPPYRNSLYFRRSFSPGFARRHVRVQICSFRARARRRWGSPMGTALKRACSHSAVTARYSSRRSSSR